MLPPQQCWEEMYVFPVLFVELVCSPYNLFHVVTFHVQKVIGLFPHLELSWVFSVIHFFYASVNT